MSVLRWIWNTVVVILAFAFFFFVGLVVVGIVGNWSVWAILSAGGFAFWMCMVCCVGKPATSQRSVMRRATAASAAPRNHDAPTRDDRGGGSDKMGGLAAGVGFGAAVAAFSASSDEGGAGFSTQLSGGDLFDGQGGGFTTINPATGLPMVGDSTVGFDVGGNVYGTTSATDSFSSDSSGSSMDFGSASYDSGNSSASFGSDPW